MKQILPLATIWMDLEGIMLSKILHGITDRKNLKKRSNLWKQRVEKWLPRAGVGE